MTKPQNNKENTVEEIMELVKQYSNADYLVSEENHNPLILEGTRIMLESSILSYGQSMKEEGKREALGSKETCN